MGDQERRRIDTPFPVPASETGPGRVTSPDAAPPGDVRGGPRALERARHEAATLVLANARLERELAVLRAEREIERQGEHDARALAEGAQLAAEATRDDARAAEQRALFLAEAGRVLGQSLDHTVTLQAVARLLVPTLADYCVVEIVDDAGVLWPLAVVHADERRAPAVAELYGRFADAPEAPSGVRAVLRTGRAELVHDVGEHVASRARDAEHLALVRAVGLVSSMIVPLAARGQIIGALTLAATAPTAGGSGRRFVAADLLYAEDVGRRASTAIENARLHDALAVTNEMLETQQVELELQQAQLQEQMAELEAQAEELAAQNAALERANAALAEATAVAEAATAVADAARRAATVARGDAETANAAKTQFLANMSHELRTPLNAIAGYTQLLELGIEGAVTDGQQGYLARIGRAQQHLLTLINDVLAFAKLEVGQAPLRHEDVAVGAVCARLEELVRPQLDAKGLAYTCALDEPAADAASGASLAVRADPDRTLQILVNLVGNAVKFTARGGAVRIAAHVSRESADAVHIVVADTGRGIPADRLAAIFEPFVQVDAGRTRAQDGVGLGLAISRDLARRMGGDLTAESEIGVGSAFTVELPRATSGA